MRTGTKVVIVALASLAVLTGLAELAVAAGWVSPFILAPPSQIWEAAIEMVVGERLGAAFIDTIGITLLAIALAIGIGLPCGWALWRFERYGRAYEGWLGALFASPKLLLYPLFLVLLGRNLGTLVVMGFVTATIPIMLKTREGLMTVSPTLINVGRSFNLTDRQILWKVMFPSAVPVIFTGIRLGMIYTLIAIIALEFLLDFEGLGGMVGEMYDRYNIPGMYAAIIFVVVMCLVYFHIVQRIQTWLRSA
ncbi:MAG: ABC transporter permease subunit [Alphaproteobacteria bacterium]|nr:ABC transporter permease subunit [Alphaproteobacteria bacterium]